MRTIGLIARQSTDYVERFFEHLLSGDTVVPLRSAEDKYRIDASGVEDTVEPAEGGGWLEQHIEFPSSDARAQIAFTSGTEGEPKGVVLTSANLADTVERICAVMQIDASICEYVGVPVYHSFGFGRCRVIAAVGGKAFIPTGGFNPREIATMVAADEINAISAVPSLWRIALQNAQLFAECGHKVRWIEIGSQAMSVDEKRRMKQLFPKARIVQHYGLTEASRATFLDISGATDAQLDSVGTANGDVEIAIAESGRIRIRGSNVAAALLVEGRTITNVDSAGWLTTNDLGEIRDGMLRFLGRADDVINSGGIKIAPDQLEDKLLTRLDMSQGLAIAKVPDAARGDGILVAIQENIEPTDELVLAQTAEALLEYGINAGTSLHLIRLAELPATDTGKIKRSELAEIFLSMTSLQTTQGSGGGILARAATLLRSRRPKTVKALFAREFPGVNVSGNDTFVRLGGDSLSFVNVSISLEEILGQLPEDWQNKTASELDSIRPSKRFLHYVDTSLFLRFIGIVAVVTGHFSLLPVGGATYLLLAIAGFNFARFQVPNVVQRNTVTPILMTAMRLAVPLLLMIAALQLRQQDLRPMEFSLLMNWLPAEGQLLDFWFIEFMVQVFLMLAVLFAFPGVRRSVESRPKRFAWLLLGISAAAATLLPLVWDTAPMFDRVPHMLVWLFALGWTIRLAATPLARIAIIALTAALPLLVWGPYSEVSFWVANGQPWVWFGCLVLLFVDKIPVPYPINKLAFWVGGASMMIYIVHWQVHFNWQRLGLIDNDFVDIIVAIVGGVICWWIWEKVTRFVAERFSRRKQPTPASASLAQRS